MKHFTRWGPPCFALALIVALGIAADPLHAAVALIVPATGIAVGHALGAIALATVPAVTTRPLQELLGELKGIQDKYAGKPMPADEAKKFGELAAEAKAMQDEADRADQIKGLERFAAQVPNPTVPGDRKDSGLVLPGKEIVGYVTLGELFVKSEAYRSYISAGMPQAMGAPLSIQSLQQKFVPVTREMLESKAVPDVAALITPQRLTEIVRTDEHPVLTLRSLVNVQQTGSSSVEYPVLTSYTDAAAGVAEQGVKPEGALVMDTATSPVRTQAVTMPVTEQQLQDAPQVQGIIDTEMRFDLSKLEEREGLWGDGTGQSLLGINNTPGVLAGRTKAGDTLVDKIRRAITDVRVAGLEPNGVMIHPYDWEDVVLLKGADEHYIWVVVQTAEGLRIWGLRVIESSSMQKPTITAPNTTYERRVLVGDFQRGATIWDRQQAAVAVGWVNDQFIKNMRTIRAEQRLAFGVKRPKAFRYIVAQAEAA